MEKENQPNPVCAFVITMDNESRFKGIICYIGDLRNSLIKLARMHGIRMEHAKKWSSDLWQAMTFSSSGLVKVPCIFETEEGKILKVLEMGVIRESSMYSDFVGEPEEWRYAVPFYFETRWGTNKSEIVDILPMKAIDFNPAFPLKLGVKEVPPKS